MTARQAGEVVFVQPSGCVGPSTIIADLADVVSAACVRLMRAMSRPVAWGTNGTELEGWDVAPFPGHLPTTSAER